MRPMFLLSQRLMQARMRPSAKTKPMSYLMLLLQVMMLCYGVHPGTERSVKMMS